MNPIHIFVMVYQKAIYFPIFSKQCPTLSLWYIDVFFMHVNIQSFKIIHDCITYKNIGKNYVRKYLKYPYLGLSITIYLSISLFFFFQTNETLQVDLEPSSLPLIPYQHKNPFFAPPPPLASRQQKRSRSRFMGWFLAVFWYVVSSTF